jgi:CelD/BcsL family acetyltransferase involved in cellulose biosynthesis
MASSVTVVDPCTDPGWADLVGRAPHGCVFHHPAWLQLIRDQYGYPMSAVCVRDGGEIAAGLPLAYVRSWIMGKRLVALPFSDFCPPVFAHPPSRETGLTLAEAVAARREAAGIDLEVRAHIGEISPSSVRPVFWHHVVPLDPRVAVVEQNFRKSQVRRGIAKARREGVRVELRTDDEALKVFYGLHVSTRKRQGVPVQPKRFIRRLTALFGQGLGFVMLARLEDTPLAAAVFLTWNGTLLYKYGASDARHLRKRPNNLLFMEAIRWGCTHGCRSLDLGRTELDNEGLRSFKNSWGAIESPLAYTYAPSAPQGGCQSTPRLAAIAIQKGPRSLGRLLGEIFYRHSA